MSSNTTVKKLGVRSIAGTVVDLALNAFNAIKNRGFWKKLPTVDEGVVEEENYDRTREYHMALLVRKDLQMTEEKVAEQCALAKEYCYKEGLKSCPEKIRLWESNNKHVDVFHVFDKMFLKKYHEFAIDNGFNTCLVKDIHGFKTVVAIGPDMSEKLELLTRRLEVYI